MNTQEDPLWYRSNHRPNETGSEKQTISGEKSDWLDSIITWTNSGIITGIIGLMLFGVVAGQVVPEILEEIR